MIVFPSNDRTEEHSDATKAQDRNAVARQRHARESQPRTTSQQCGSCLMPLRIRQPWVEEIKEFEMTKSKGIGRGGARPGSGRKPKAITPRVQALKDALAALRCGASKFNDADRRFVRAMIALGAPNNATASAFGISEVELLAKFPDELESRAADLRPARHSH